MLLGVGRLHKVYCGSVNSTMETLTQAMISVSGKWDRVLDLAEKFLLGGSGNGRGNQ